MPRWMGRLPKVVDKVIPKPTMILPKVLPKLPEILPKVMWNYQLFK